MKARRGRIDWRDESGQVAGVEALPFGILLFVVGSLLLANAWAVIDTKMAATSAAREAVRTFVESAGSPGVSASAAFDAATSAAFEALAAHGRDPSRATVTGADGPHALARCHAVTITVGYPVPALTLPVMGAVGEGLIVRASHTEIVDPYRDREPGEGGEAICRA